MRVPHPFTALFFVPFLFLFPATAQKALVEAQKKAIIKESSQPVAQPPPPSTSDVFREQLTIQPLSSRAVLFHFDFVTEATISAERKHFTLSQLFHMFQFLFCYKYPI
jgi:hypothetical protein